MVAPASWKPPVGFIEVESHLPGVVVFAPAPVRDRIPAEQRFSCPQCGAETAFDPSAASVTCSHCGYVQPVQAQVLGEQAAQQEFTLDALRQSDRGWGEERRELHCQACGADISIAATDLSATCPFCGSNQVINRQASQESLRPGYLIPFKLDPKAGTEQARRWLGQGWMFPKDLSSSGTSLALRGVYLPFWTFSAQIISDWEAQVGYERTERYYDSGSKSWQSRTVIDWRWEQGQVTVPIQDMLESGTQSVSHLLLSKVYPYDLTALSDYQPGFLAGWQAKTYDIPLQAAWDTARTQMRELAKKACNEDIPTHHVRNFSMKADFEAESWRLVLLPVFVAGFSYQGKPYQVLVNGQTGEVAGQKPVAWWKVWLAIAALVFPGLVLGLIGLPLLPLGGAGAIPLIAGVIIFFAGLVASGFILKNAMQAGER